ncbi:MAG: hypothetical protein M3Q49_16555, partial [Actinomycetota bacterium]|nr:hypothetical protein [Actinomycetota bacterium]
MDPKKRALLGALSGAGGTLALTGFRKSLNQLDVVHRTAPQKVVDRLEELGLLDGWTRERRRVLMIAAHYGYGVGAGTAFGLLRRQERGELLTEVAAGAALGVLSWGRGGRPGCRSSEPRTRPGTRRPRRLFCPSSTTPCSAPSGAR